MEKSDEVLVQESLSGSLGAFDDLMARYQKLVYKVALGYSRSREEALDVTQNVFLRAYEKLRLLRENGNFKAWILSITFHESVNWFRKQRRHDDHDPLESDDYLTAADISQEDTVIRRERAAYLLQSLSCLNPRHRLVVILRFYEGMSLKDIGEVAGCSEPVIKNILYRSLDKLRQRLVQTGKVFQ